MVHKHQRLFMIYPVLIVIFVLGSSVLGQNRSELGTAHIGLESGTPSFLRSGPMGELIAVYTPRNRDEINRRLEFEKSNQQSAASDVTENLRLIKDTDGKLLIMNDELRTMKTRLSVAKKDKKETDRAALEVEYKRQQNEKEYFDILQQANKSDSEWLNQQSNAAASRVKALELESDLARKYEELTNATVVKPEDVKSYRDLLRRTLEGQQVAADRASATAKLQKTVADRRLKQLKALSKLQP